MGRTALIFSADGYRVDCIVVSSMYFSPIVFDSLPFPSYSDIESTSICYLPVNASSNSIDHVLPPQRTSQRTPTATRMRERDADAMEKYRLRQRSGSATTASTTESPSQNGNVLSGSPSMVPPVEDDDLSALHPLVTVGSVAPRRRLRPSASATQLRTHSESQ